MQQSRRYWEGFPATDRHVFFLRDNANMTHCAADARKKENLDGQMQQIQPPLTLTLYLTQTAL
jgi:hypothetical protein